MVRLAILVFVVALTACSSAPVRNQYFTLTGATPAADTPLLIQIIGIGPVTVPGTLQRKQLVSFRNEQQVMVAPHVWWAEDLEAMIARVIAQNVSQSLGNANVWSYPWSASERPPQQVHITLTQFGGSLGGQVVLQAKWRVLSDMGKTEQFVGNTYLTTQARNKTYAAYVAALNELTDSLAQKIAASLPAQ